MPPKQPRPRVAKRSAAQSQPSVPAVVLAWSQGQAQSAQRDGSAAAAAAAAAAPPAKRQRKRKADAHGHKEAVAPGASNGAAAAAQPPHVHAAAAATPLATASGPNLNERAAVAAAAAPSAAGAPVLSDAPQCPVCWEAYKCEEAKADCDSLIPRTLPCTHSACSACLLKYLTPTPGRFKCPLCNDNDRPVQLPKGMAAAAVSTPTAWLRCIPQSADIIMAIKRSQQLEAHLQLAQSQQQRCSYPACAAAAVQWCQECASEMCAAHDALWHNGGSRSAHKRIPLADRAAVRQGQMAEALTAEADRLRSVIQSAVQQREHTLSIQADSIAAMRRDHGRLEEHLRMEHQRQMAQLLADHSRLQQDADTKLAAGQASLSQLREIAGRTQGVSAAEALAQEAAFDSWVATIRPSIRPPGDGRLLSRAKLSDGLYERLQRFLGASVSLTRAQLLYRATRDGFKASDLWKRCAGKGPTLTMAKVAGNGHVCGAHTPVSWPADAATADQAGARFLPDPSGRTFLFSLVNAHGRPVKLRLKAGEMAKAVHVKSGAYGPGFGGGADVRLMWGQQSANHAIGCFAHPCSFEIDQDAEAAASLPPIRFAYDKTLLAGDDGAGGVGVSFAADEIEVYQL